MARPIRVDPHGGPVTVSGEMIEPGPGRLEIDLWRHVRHPPPDFVHVLTIKEARVDEVGYFEAGHPGALVGKVITWVWNCAGLPTRGGRWRVRVDVRQDGRSLGEYPAEYWGPLPGNEPLSQLKISECVEEAARR